MGTGLSANLDFLRVTAVLLVLAQHVCKRMHVEQIGWVATSSLGLFGVLLFFVHTSLVLMYSMERSGLTGWLLFKNFYVRRVFRIYPLSVVAVLAALALGLDSDINGVAGLSHGALPGKAIYRFPSVVGPEHRAGQVNCERPLVAAFRSANARVPPISVCLASCQMQTNDLAAVGTLGGISGACDASASCCHPCATVTSRICSQFSWRLDRL